ncbi:hypothetical protein CEUSTIGMA_g4018.t1 [Chlamydomonas eustigma]|uniref:Uncharacterized protein n=1 Tax=Chlamydomonas eustigma TaxID=1157962 RepID=A0A250X107_9CHLO|nr:hypothetical protein CEUSTIGMA_g4018.t1 [Chlamydomonas eustigma]|eukprot:GAX76572.1 hypothetical protein CEUSTIGMA_g4018.t1 [Chlamydomonas eustigma]
MSNMIITTAGLPSRYSGILHDMMIWTSLLLFLSGACFLSTANGFRRSTLTSVISTITTNADLQNELSIRGNKSQIRDVASASTPTQPTVKAQELLSDEGELTQQGYTFRRLRWLISHLIQNHENQQGSSSTSYPPAPPGTPVIVQASPVNLQGGGSNNAIPSTATYGPSSYGQQAYNPVPSTSTSYSGATASPTPGAVPVDQVGLAAAGDSYDSYNSGIDVVTSNPISVSNPIDLNGGSYNGQLGLLTGK